MLRMDAEAAARGDKGVTLEVLANNDLAGDMERCRCSAWRLSLRRALGVCAVTKAPEAIAPEDEESDVAIACVFGTLATEAALDVIDGEDCANGLPLRERCA